MQFGMTVDDVCMSDFSSEEDLGRFLDLFAQLGVRATFFVVPLAEGVPLKERTGYVVLLRRALAEGHEVAHHGLEHDRFEVGIPPAMVLSLSHEWAARERLERERDIIEAALSVSGIRERLARGRHLLEEALGAPIVGFRAPCLQTCENLFTALEEEGYRYDSSLWLQEAGWDLIQDKLEAVRLPITRERFEACRRRPGLVSLPMTTDYTWYLSEERYAPTYAMARSDLLDCLREDLPLVTLSHVSPFFGGDRDCGQRLFRGLVAFAREAAARADQTCEFVPLSEVKV